MRNAPGPEPLDSGGLNNDIFSRVVNVAAKVLFGSGFSKLCLIGAEFFLAVYLGTSGYGLFAIGFAFLLVVSMLVQLGLNFGVVQYISIYTEDGNDQSKAAVARVALIVVLFVSVLCAATVYSSSEWLATRLFSQPDLAPILILVAFVIPFEALNQTFSAVFRGLRKYRYYILAQDLIRNLSLLACVPLLITGVLQAERIFLIVGIGAGCGTIISLLIVLRHVPVFRRVSSNDLSIFRELLSFSYMLFLWQALQKTANQLMVLIAGTVLASTDVGVLALAVRFLTVLNFPQSAVNATTSVEFARFNHRQEYGAITELLQVLALVLTLMSLAFICAIGLNANWLFSMFGNGYESFGWVLQVLLLAKVIDVGGGPVGQILIACRKRRTVLALGFVDVAMQFLFVVPLMHVMGLSGAVVGNAIRYLIIVLARHFALYISLGVYAISRTLIFVLLMGSGVFACGWLLSGIYTSMAANMGISLIATLAVGCLLISAWQREQQFAEVLKGGGVVRK